MSSPDTPPFTGYPRLITIRRFRDLPDALLAKSVLESADIQCFLADDNIIRMDWLWSYAVGEIKVRVRDNDAKLSDELLKANQNPPAFIDFGGIQEYAQPACPNCGSFDIFHDELTRAAYAALIMSLLIIQLLWYPRRRKGLGVSYMRLHVAASIAIGLSRCGRAPFFGNRGTKCQAIFSISVLLCSVNFCSCRPEL